MSNHIIAVPNSIELASFIGKKGSENSITFYNRSLDGNVITALVPTSVEDKFYAISEILTISEIIVLSTAYLDRLFGELLIASKLLGKGVFLTSENADSKMIMDSGLSNYKVCNRDTLLTTILSIDKKSDPGSACRIDIDKAFNVKGIGAVALGVVISGTVSVHDELWHSSGKKVLVRSLQSQDVDVKTAGPGTRIGIGLKNIEPEAIEKGSVIYSLPLSPHKRLKIKMNLAEINKEQLEPGKFYGLGSNFSYSMAKVESISGAYVTFALEKALSVLEGDECLFLREAPPRIFASGKITELL
ncbi:MAG: EF-Tu/IF-2/RF-3 family GTPase [Candidatus Micrarchaeaceae archaeon]